MAKRTPVVQFIHFPKAHLGELEPMLWLEGWERLYGLGFREAMVTARLYLPNLFIVHDTKGGTGEGLCFIRELRQHLAFERSKVLYFSTDTGESLQVQAIDAGADLVLTPDFPISVQAVRINTLIRKLQGIARADMSSESFAIHPESLTVSLSGKKVQLVKKEFELLHLLCSAPDRIHYRQDILKHVWKDSSLKSDRTLDVHIRKLRKKLGDAFIRTVTGVGYKFEWPHS
jgi:two-component system, OmpR family, alkaline phosphatase synthesis response regulator PhoP